MILMELRSESEWEEIVARFGETISMTACLIDAGGANPRFCHPERSALCAAIRDNDEAATFICSRVNVAMLAVARKTLRPLVEMCDAGLLRVVVPVVDDGEQVGQVVACGLASADEDEEIEAFLVSRQLGISEEEVLELARSTPSATEEELLQHAAELFARLHPDL